MKFIPDSIRGHIERPAAKILFWLLLIFTLSVALDQATKVYARAHFKGHDTLHVLGDFFVIHYAENNGSFLSMGSNLPPGIKFILLTVIPVFVLFYFILYTLFSADLRFRERAVLSVIIAGGVSNIVDRIIFAGWVTDFLHFSLGFVRTGILNIADMYITFGVIIFLWMQFRKEAGRKALEGQDMGAEEGDGSERENAADKPSE